ncbi:DUF397 domain-containing protein [Streptomyces endophytica]|uniref:DUF397 domain-containing protein n=1 Tax=Streptomyces endophytica TaxID=2991496 RepID=A0ABY6P9Q4_9ACTN|nr:DUF397 domain-containing protein [Streptomyces endophytica]UZJ30553.1 DUF397 domain-containing protein [Streptomyces endophytica]
MSSPTITWRKSSYCDGGDDNCIEVADGIPNAVPVRDSKNPDGPTLCIPVAAWSSFIAGVKGDAWTGGLSSRP